MRKSNAHNLWVLPVAALVVTTGVVIGAVGAFADVNGDQTQKAVLVHRLNADEVKARALETHLLGEQQHTDDVRVADMFGPSDEEKAHEANQDASIQQLNQKVNDLEDTLRRLTGQMEQMDHRMSETDARIERMQKDFDYKICTMAQQQLGADSQGGIPCGGEGAAQPSASYNAPPPGGATALPPPSGPNAPRSLAPPPGVLGTIPSNTPMPIPPPANASDASGPAPAESPNRAQYQAAMNLLSKAQYDEARAAFRNFADANPQDQLAPQAVYWIGSIAYLQKDYSNAARAFAEEIKNYGTSSRAPDSMLKLGQSLLAMNQKPQGCTALEALPAKYPQASPNVLGQAKAARKAAGCK